MVNNSSTILGNNWKLSPFNKDKDWFKELKSSEILKKDGKEFVFLRGLERLAKERGVVTTTSIVVQSPTPQNLCAVVSFAYGFSDGAVHQASADATYKNCGPGFRLYLTAMAESRAKARALRTAFGISACSVEEIGDVVDEDLDVVPASDEQKYLIKHLARKRGVALEDILEIEVDNKKLDDLTKSESLRVIGRLNRANPNRKVKK